MSLKNLIVTLIAPFLVALSSSAIAGQGSGAGDDRMPSTLAFALPESAQNNQTLVDGLREQIRADIQFRGGNFSDQVVTWENGRKIELLCGEFPGHSAHGKAQIDLSHLYGLPLQDGIPRDFRGKCDDSNPPRPFIADMVWLIETGSCGADALVDALRDSCQNDPSCSFRVAEPNDQKYLQIGMKQLPGTANYYSCH